MGLLDRLFGKKTTEPAAPAAPPAAKAPAKPATKDWQDESGVPQELAASEVNARLKGANPPVLLDVREEFEREQHGYIPGSLHISMNDIQGRQHELDPTKPVIVYCASGMRSMEVGAFLLTQGFKDVANLNGGFNAWTGERTK